jgi:hypothetical protein
MIINTIIRSIAWTLTRRITNDAYNKVKHRSKKPTNTRKRRKT